MDIFQVILDHLGGVTKMALKVSAGLRRSAAVCGAAVSGIYFSHPDSHYFMISDLQSDQIEDYANRKGMSVEEAEKWLAPWMG